MHLDHHRVSLRNCFGGHVLERSAARREQEAWLATRLADPRTRIVPVAGTQHPFTTTRAPVYVSPSELVGVELRTEAAVFLGEEQEVAYFAVDLSEHAEAVRHLGRTAEFLELRPVAALLSAVDAARLAYARAMLHWHRTHRFCGRCGAPTASAVGGHVRRCVAATCGSEAFPRTDPAIIVLVTHGKRMLLARHPSWAPTSLATLAGFVEPGETLEGAVIREVWEEVGVRLRSIRYHSSQPWPFPGTVMLGFVAEAESEVLQLDPREIAEARWLSREDVREQVAAGSLVLPPEVSISYRLIEDWLEQRRPG